MIMIGFLSEVGCCPLNVVKGADVNEPIDGKSMDPLAVTYHTRERVPIEVVLGDAIGKHFGTANGDADVNFVFGDLPNQRPLNELLDAICARGALRQAHLELLR